MFQVTEQLLEDLLDKLEKGSGLNHELSFEEAKKLLKEDDAQIQAVFHYWRRKRDQQMLVCVLRGLLPVRSIFLALCFSQT